MQHAGRVAAHVIGIVTLAQWCYVFDLQPNMGQEFSGNVLCWKLHTARLHTLLVAQVCIVVISGVLVKSGDSPNRSQAFTKKE